MFRRTAFRRIMVNQLSVGALQTNCIIIPIPHSKGECVLFDPGGDGDLIIARLGKLLLRPRYIVLTHAHFDHILALPELAAAYPDAEIAIHRNEADRLGPLALELHKRDLAEIGASSFMDSVRNPLPEADILLEEGSVIGPFTVLHLPGHSPGSIGLYWKDEKILVSGDTLFRAGVGRTDLPGGSWEDLEKSLKRIFSMDGDIEVYPGHGPSTTIRRERV
jgi:glyoxylase-like metal-dependent hydrolase (beta-lactamase superfamily II)